MELAVLAGMLSKEQRSVSGYACHFASITSIRAFADLLTHEIEQASQPQVPDGYKLVPVDPTKEMMDAGEKELGLIDTRWDVVPMWGVWNAMIAATPVTGDLVTDMENDIHYWRSRSIACDTKEIVLLEENAMLRLLLAEAMPKVGDPSWRKRATQSIKDKQ